LIILIIRGEGYKLQSSRYAVFSTLLSLYASSIQICPSAPCSQIFLVYVSLLLRKQNENEIS
jgi:hypothetical protein